MDRWEELHAYKCAMRRYRAGAKRRAVSNLYFFGSVLLAALLLFVFTGRLFNLLTIACMLVLMFCARHEYEYHCKEEQHD